MRIARFVADGDPQYGIVQGEEGEQRIAAIVGDPLTTAVEPTGVIYPLEEVRLLAPVIPRSKVVGVGRNYADHAAEMGNLMPSVPLLFLKPNTSVCGPGDPIVLPRYSYEVHHEAELAIVISRICKDVPAADADRVILGYTVANDVSARDVQRNDLQWTRAKGFDTACPLGPWIETDLDLKDASVRCWVNGQLRQDGTTRNMHFSVGYLVAYISSVFTLLPGDVILTGTPSGVGIIDPGDRVSCEVGGIGVLTNPVVRRKSGLATPG